MIFAPFLPLVTLGNICKSIFLKRSYMGQTSLIGTLRGPCIESVRLGGVKLDGLSLGIKQTVHNIEFSVRPGLSVFS